MASTIDSSRAWSRSMSGLQLLPRLRRARNILPLALDLTLVFFLFALDLRDLYYKVAWIGPHNTFSFYAISSRAIDNSLLLPASALAGATANTSVWLNTSNADAVSDTVALRQSGWLSMTAACERIRTADTGMVFVGVMGENCSIGPPGHSSTIPALYMSGSARPDSMAWAACKLLYEHRKPPICAANVVTGFLTRYGLEDRAVTREMLTPPHTMAEHELLALLLVVSKSFPLHQTTCIEGFAYTGPGVYTTTLFGCGSPNVLESAFVGLHATAFALLQQDKAWLTADTINVWGLKYTMRQNCRSEFAMSVNATSGALLQTPKSITNFSSSGALYLLVLVVDVVLMLVHLWSALEVARLVLIPLVQTHLKAKHGDGSDKLAQDYATVFTCSLYRSRPIMLMTLVTQLLSWIIILPNSIIWTWSTSSKIAKLQAYLSSLRLWVLILVAVNEIWDVIVVLHEPLAYAVTKSTYVSSLEIIVIGALVSYAQRKVLFAVTDTKYAMEHQRNKDTTSFANKIAFTNAFNEEIDHYLNTPTDVLRVVYGPLLSILGRSLLYVLLVLVVRFVGHKLCAAVQRWWERRCQIIDAATTNVAIVGAIKQTEHTQQNQPTSELLVASASTATTLTFESAESYKRLPLEDLLNVPIRARCLVRSGMEIESETVNDETNQRETFIRPPYFLEHGIMVDRGTMRSRRGFFRFLQPRVDLKHHHVTPAQSTQRSQQASPLGRSVNLLPAIALIAVRHKDM